MSTPFEKGTLWAKARAVSEAARASGALAPIETRAELVEDAELTFALRVVSSVAHKHAVSTTHPEGHDPFLPYEEALFVADVSPTHLALLNKFPVLEPHLLVVTRTFVDQAAPLELADFEALCACMAEGPALGFYNSGPVAGASQKHRHLQLVPLPAAPEAYDEGTPIDGAIVDGALPFAHAAGPWEPEPAKCLARFQRLLKSAGADKDGASWNLLCTPEWMLVVPRTRAEWEGVSVNALGFCGSLLLRDDAQLEAVKKAGPAAALRAVTMP